jgi:Zn-finger nucleic acid-binding protein
MSERLTVHIDYCPKCRGIWRTSGKLDKLIEKPGPSPDSREKNKRLSDDDDEGGSVGIFREY